MFDWMILSRERTLSGDRTGRGIWAGIVFTLVTETEINNYFGSLEVSCIINKQIGSTAC